MFIAVQGKFININHIIMVEKIDASSAKIFLSHQNEPIEVALSYASILGKINRALGILEETEEDKMPSVDEMQEWELESAIENGGGFWLDQ